MSNNLPTYTLGTTRAGEVAAADWAGGLNKGGSNAPAIGVNTGNVNPKEQDWPRVADTSARQSGVMGEGDTDINTVNGADVNNTVAFIEADSNAAADAVMDVATGAVNRTGAAVATGDFVWGEIPVA